MNIFITRSAIDDIVSGYDFYEAQELGIGAYFEDSIFFWH